MPQASTPTACQPGRQPSRQGEAAGFNPPGSLHHQPPSTSYHPVTSFNVSSSSLPILTLVNPFPGADDYADLQEWHALAGVSARLKLASQTLALPPDKDWL